jgi:hypothetical protein
MKQLQQLNYPLSQCGNKCYQGCNEVHHHDSFFGRLVIHIDTNQLLKNNKILMLIFLLTPGQTFPFYFPAIGNKFKEQ